MLLQPSESFGEDGRQAAIDYLTGIGFKILGLDWQCEAGKADVIADDHGALVLITVARRRATMPQPEETASARIRQLAIQWASDHGHSLRQARLDMISLIREDSGGFTIEHLRAVS